MKSYERSNLLSAFGALDVLESEGGFGTAKNHDAVVRFFEKTPEWRFYGERSGTAFWVVSFETLGMPMSVKCFEYEQNVGPNVGEKTWSLIHRGSV